MHPLPSLTICEPHCLKRKKKEEREVMAGRGWGVEKPGTLIVGKVHG